MTIPDKYYNLHHIDITTKKTKEDTGRICVVCNKPIYRTYTEEYAKEDGTQLSKICTWDQYYTCCDDCKEERIRKADYIGAAERDENGVPLWSKLTVPGAWESRCWIRNSSRRRN